MWNILWQKRAIIENKKIADSQVISQGEVVDFDSSGEIIENETAVDPSWENFSIQSVDQSTNGYRTRFCWLSEDLIGVIFQPDTSSTATYAYTYSFSQKKMISFKSVTAASTPQTSMLHCCRVNDTLFAGVQMTKGNSNAMVFWVSFNKDTGEITALTSTSDSAGTLWDCLSCCQVADAIFLSANSAARKTVTIYKNTASLTSGQVESQQIGVYTHSSLVANEIFMKKNNDSTIVGVILWGTSLGSSVQFQLFSVDLSSFSVTWGTPQGQVIMKDGSELTLSNSTASAYRFLDLTELYCVVQWTKYGSASIDMEGIAKIPYNNLVFTPTETAYVDGTFIYTSYNTALVYEKINKCYIGIAGTVDEYIICWDEDTWSVKRYFSLKTLYKKSIDGSVIISVNGTNYLFDNKGYLLTFSVRNGNIGGSFTNSSNTAIALQDGVSGETIPVILEGTIKQDWVTIDTSIRSTGINAQGVSDKWLNVMPKWQYQLLKG